MSLRFAGCAFRAATGGLAVVVLFGCSSPQPPQPKPPQRCEHTGTVALEASARETIDVQLTDDFVYALQGEYDEAGKALISIVRYSMDTLQPERIRLDVPLDAPTDSRRVIPDIVAAGGGLYFVTPFKGRAGEDADWFEFWFWPDGEAPKRLGREFWYPGFLGAQWNGIGYWDGSLFAARYRSGPEPITELMRHSSNGEWASVWSAAIDGWLVMSSDENEFAFAVSDGGDLTAYRLGRSDAILPDGPATTVYPEAWPRTLGSVDGFLYALMDGEGNPHTEPAGRLESGAVFEIDRDGVGTQLLRWKFRHARLATSANAVFLAIEDEDLETLPERGLLLVQSERGGEFEHVRDIGVPETIVADEWRLALSHWQAEEPHRLLELTFLRSGSDIPGCE